jgi:hypothetical protein
MEKNFICITTAIKLGGYFTDGQILILKTLNSAHAVQLYVWYDSHNKERLFTNTAQSGVSYVKLYIC